MRCICDLAKQVHTQDPGLLGPVSWADITEGQKEQ